MKVFGLVCKHFFSFEQSTHYQRLGVDPTSTFKEIRFAYLLKTKEIHPDVKPSKEAASLFSELSDSYRILIDPISRRQYDLSLGLTITHWGVPSVLPTFKNEQVFLALEKAQIPCKFSSSIEQRFAILYHRCPSHQPSFQIVLIVALFVTVWTLWILIETIILNHNTNDDYLIEDLQGFGKATIFPVLYSD